MTVPFLQRKPLCLALLFFLTGCGGGVSSSYLEWAQRSFAEAPDSTVGPRDRFSLEIYPEAALNRTYTVSPEGTINHPLIGPLRVGGRSCYEIEVEVSRRLQHGFLRDPSVSCTVDEINSLQVVVIGAVATAGPLAYSDGMTLIDLISRIGGFAPTAAKDRVQITRTYEGELVEIIVPAQQVMRGRAPNILIWPGDIVYVPSSGLIQ